MSTSTMSQPNIVSREVWLAARKRLLASEKALTRDRDEVKRASAAADGEITEDTSSKGRTQRPARSVRGPSAAHRLPLHVRSGAGRGLSRCSFVVDNIGHWLTCTRAIPGSCSSPARRSRASRLQRTDGLVGALVFVVRHDFNYDFHTTHGQGVAPVEYNYLRKPSSRARTREDYSLGARARRERLPA